MNNSVYQEIFDVLQSVLPSNWNKVLLFIGYTDGSYTMKYFVQDICGDYIDCFKQDGISRIQLIKLFMHIDEIIAPQRNAMDKNSRWTVMTMKVDAEGNMNAEFDYTDISDNTIQYEMEWESKYLI